MIAGALNFTLGLQANQFLNSLGVAGGRLLAFTGIATSFGAALNKMFQAVQQGGQLKDLSAAAGIAVRDLYKLRRGFEEVGASAESVPAVINRLRRTLAGGQQDNLLASMGLDPATLARMNPARQFEAVAAALGRLNVNASAGAAQSLFGREGAQAMLQIANSGQDFAAAMNRAANDATIWDRVATQFDAIGDKITEMQRHIESLWALLAGALINAFQNGRLIDLLFDIFSSVFQALGAALPGLLMGGFVKLGELLLRVLMVPLTYLQSALDASVQGFMGAIARIPGVREAVGVPANFKPESWGDIMGRNREQGLNFFGANLDEMSQFAARSAGGGLEAGRAVIAGLYDRLFAEIGQLPPGAANRGAVPGAISFGGSAGKPNVTEIERMGFIFNRGGFSASDHARNTADNTRRTVTELQRLNEQIGTLTSGAGYENVD